MAELHHVYIKERSYQMQYYSTIKELVDGTCNLFQTRDAFIFKQGEEYFKKQYGEFQEDCNHIARQLVKQNVTDVHTALLARTSYQGLVALFGSIFASNTCVVPDFNYTVDAMEDLYAMADTYILLYDEEFKEKAEELRVRSNVIEKIISIQELLHTEKDLSVQLPKQEPDHPAIIISEGYGITEASPTITNNNFKNFKIGSVGKPLPDTTIEHSAITTKLAMGEDKLGVDSINEVKTDTLHKLPIVYPIITSYNHHAHLLSIIGAYKETYPWVMSNYVNVFCHRDNIKHSFCDFYFPMPNEVRAPELCPWILSQKISADLFQSTKLDILDFVLNCIDQKTYVHIMIDYFYVEQTARYQNTHRNHDLLIYGYDKKQEILYCSDFLFSNLQKYTFSHISFSALREGFMNCKLDKSSGYLKGQFYLYKMREAKHVRYRFNPIHIVNALKQYVNSDIPEYWLIHNIRDNLDDRAFGLDVYDVLAEHVEIVKRNQLGYIDIRLFYVLYDHKKIMKHRFEYLMEVDEKNIALYQEMVKQFEGLEQDLQIIVFLIIKFHIKNKDSVADNIIRCLKEIRDKEEQVIRSFLKEY